MKIFIADTYEEMSKQAAEDIIALMDSFKDPVLCAASGDTPGGIYKVIAEKVNNKDLVINDWSFLGLDEWSGMNGSDEGSCRFYLDKQLFQPAHIAGKKICFFDGKAEDPEGECRRIEDFITEHDGIDVAILGLGMNGHAGMNEPGTSFESRSHIADLDPETQQVGQKYFKKKQELITGLTLGLGTLMEARHIILLVSGKHKASIIQRVMDEEISEELPASIFRKHPSFSIYLDNDAAGK